jgi:hypothetical protein
MQGVLFAPAVFPRLLEKILVDGAILFVPSAVGVALSIAVTDPCPAIYWFSAAAISATIAIFVWDEIVHLNRRSRIGVTTVAALSMLVAVWQGDSWVISKQNESARASIVQIAEESKQLAGMRRAVSASSQNLPNKTPTLQSPKRAKPHGNHLESKPDLIAQFFSATSPVIVLVNDSQALVRDPSTSIVVWNMTTHSSLPAWNNNNAGMYIKPGAGLLLATLDVPTIKPHISMGDKIFGFISIDCPECAVKYYWLYVVYGGKSWYSPIPAGFQPDIISVSQGMEKAQWDLDLFIKENPHGAILPPLPFSALHKDAKRP